MVRVAPAVDLVKRFRTAFEPAYSKEAEQGDELEESQATSLLVSIELRLGSRLALGARLPVTIAIFAFAENGSARVTSLGNTELSASYVLHPFWYSHTRAEARARSGAADGIGDEYGSEEAPQRNAFANLAAQRFRGYLDNALFSPHRFGLIPKASLEWQSV